MNLLDLKVCCAPATHPLPGALAGLGDPCAEELRAAGHVMHYPSGTAVFAQGDRSNRVGVIEVGHVTVSVLDADGSQVLVAIRGPGDLIGELASVDDEPHSASVIARTDLTVLLIPTADFMRTTIRHECLVEAMMRVLAARLRESDDLRVEMATKDVAARVASRLLLLSDWATGPGHALAISQQELASWVGASREAVGKALASFRKRGFVSTRRGHIVVEDEGGLRARAGT
jgi:CRP/FNR family cyclic AMP-dependent transcriptional regulator